MSGHAHHHSHSHEDAHGHEHSHAPNDFNGAFAIGVFLNLGLVVAQVFFGLIAHSLALVADAGHNFADVLGLGLAWWASRLARSAPTRKHTYGLRGVSILAALANAVLLLVTMGGVAWEAIARLKDPPPVEGRLVIWLAATGIIVNAASAWLFFSGRKGDLNVRGAFLHLAADAGISFGVVLAGAAMLWTGKLWIDPVMSLIIVVTIVYGTWGLLKEAVNLSLLAIPENIDRDAVEEYLGSVRHVVSIHDLHIWGMSTTQAALTVHLVMRPARVDDSFLAQVAAELHDKFHIEHATIQVEAGDGPVCQLAPQERV
ncbi:MAG TPA: cation diffusion facilitator family transporter [Verrucomicrobiae bacterium]|nr:cation diffusion facilitator family transporter [Verrucomicrobiae bacterium]